MEVRKCETILEKASTKSFVIALFSRMMHQQATPSDIIQTINETIEVADIGHPNVSPAVAVDRAVRILLVTHWARPTFSTDITAAYKLLLQHAKGNSGSGNNQIRSELGTKIFPESNCFIQLTGASPGLDGALSNFVVEKMIESFFLNASVSSFISQKVSRRQSDAVSFPSFHSAILACQIARDIATVSTKLYGAIQDRHLSVKALLNQLRHAARAMAHIGTYNGSIQQAPMSTGYTRSPDPASSLRTAHYQHSNVLSDCLSAFKPSKILAINSSKTEPAPRPISSRNNMEIEKTNFQDLNRQPQNVHEFTILILDSFFSLY